MLNAALVLDANSTASVTVTSLESVLGTPARDRLRRQR
jgi:hypothetical protein